MTQRYFPFRFTFKEIEPRYDRQARLEGSPDHPYWIPPTIPEAIRTVSTEDLGVYQWQPGQIQRISPAVIEGLEPYSASTMFWSEDLDRKTYLYIPYDCTKQSVKQTIAEDARYGWKRLTFHNVTTTQGPLSLIGHHYEADKIAARGAGAWMPELLPITYGGRSSQTCRIAGEMAMLLSLMALSTEKGRVIQTVQDCFRPDSLTQKWRPHGRTGRIHERGVVVEVYLDPDRGPRPDQFKLWEDGRLGPII